MAVLEAPEILDFRVRGHYPNQRSLWSNLDARTLRAKKGTKLPGYLPPVAEYRRSGAGETLGVTIRDIDLPLLCQGDSGRSKYHLKLILQAREGDRRAEDELNDSLRSHFSALGLRYDPASIVEDRYLVPSTSSADYPVETVSHKRSILLKLSQLGYPVPDFAIMTSAAFQDRARFEERLFDTVDNLQRLTCQAFGSQTDPLVFALRCATPLYVPGVMPTFLNVGVTEGALPVLKRTLGAQAADKMFLNNLRNLLLCLDREAHAKYAPRLKPYLPPEETAQLCGLLAEEVRQRDPKLLEDPRRQTAFLARQAYKQFDESRDLLLTLSRGVRHYPSLILQKMVCTVRHEEAYAGVLYSRNSRTGVGQHLESARNIFGEEIMTGTLAAEETSFTEREQVRDAFPGIYHFAPQLPELEREFETPVTIEFAAEADKRHELFALLQLNGTGMTGRAAFISVVDLHKAGSISRKRVTELICPYHVKQMESDAIDSSSISELERFCSGVAVLPRAAVTARIYFSADSALRAKREGEKACLCKRTFEPQDTVVLREMDAVISLTPAAIHVATICQSYGMPALLSLEKDKVRFKEGRLLNASGAGLAEGDWVTISSRRQALFKGKARFKPARFMRYIKGEELQLEPGEREPFEQMAYAYRYYHQLVRGLRLDQISTLSEVIRLVNLDLRGEAEEARKLVNGWFDAHEDRYVEEVFQSELGDHLNQHTVFDMLAQERKIRFFRKALARCARERIFGFTAGAFMLGRFICLPHAPSFWSAFTPEETGLLLNEWVLFEKYLQVLQAVGERRVLRARKKILDEGMDDLPLEPRSVKALIPVKLARVPLDRVRAALPSWCDRQAPQVLDLLSRPYGDFYDFSAPWALKELEKLCAEAGLSLPSPQER